MHNLNIPCDFIDDEWIRRGRLARYKLLLIPYARYLSGELAQMLKKFVSEGGTVLADRFFAFQDHLTGQFQQIPGFGLKDLTGAFLNDADYADDGETIRTHDGTVLLNISDQFRSQLHLTDGESLAEYSGGGCALSMKKDPSGGAWIFCGVELFQICRDKEENTMADFLCGVLSSQGVQPCCRIDAVPPGTIGVYPLHGASNETVYICANMLDKPIRARFEFPGKKHLYQLSGNREYTGTITEWSFQPYECFVMSDIYCFGN